MNKQGLYRFTKEEEGDYTVSVIFEDESESLCISSVTLYKPRYEKEYTYTLSRINPECQLSICSGDLLSVSANFELIKL